MGWVVELIIVLAGMPLAGCVLIGAWRALERWPPAKLAEAWRKPPPPEPLDRLEADLRRLRAELEDTEARAGLIAKNHRVQAVRGAYLDALTEACRRLDVPPPGGGDQASSTRAPGQAEIYRAEEDLRRRGLRVREPVAR
jgi:hypothetical protein